MKKYELYALPEHSGQRIDLFVSKSLPTLTRNAVQRLCEEGGVEIAGQAVGKNHRLRGGEQVAVHLPDPRPLDVAAQDIPLDIVFEDEHLLVINKPRGLVVHPAPGHEDGTLVNALLHHCGPSFSGIGGVERPGIVHRIDRMTSGLLVVAKTAMAHESLSAQAADHSMGRIYEAVVHGNVKQEEGLVDAPIGRHPSDRKKMSVNAKNGREAVTHYRVLERYKGFTHLELRLETGRTHQIRVHMAYRGHPVAGDPVYGPKKGVSSLEGQCLHARSLGLTHPATGARMEFTSELPHYFTAFLNTLRR